MRELFELFWAFAQIGSVTFGGGYAMLPLIQKKIVEDKAWATEDQVLNYYALGQCTPGIIAVNTATFIGYDRKGFWGGLFATLGMVFPSLVIIMTIARFITQFEEVEALQHAFAGIRVAVVALIVSAVIRLWRQSVESSLGATLFVISLVVIAFLNVSPILVIVLAALFGVWHASRIARAGAEEKEATND